MEGIIEAVVADVMDGRAEEAREHRVRWDGLVDEALAVLVVEGAAPLGDGGGARPAVLCGGDVGGAGRVGKLLPEHPIRAMRHVAAVNVVVVAAPHTTVCTRQAVRRGHEGGCSGECG